MVLFLLGNTSFGHDHLRSVGRGDEEIASMRGHDNASVAIRNSKPAGGRIPGPDRIAPDIDRDLGRGGGSAQQFHAAAAELRFGILPNLYSPGTGRNDG